MNQQIPLDTRDIRQILVVKPSSLGDIMHLFPALAKLRKLCPTAELDFVVNPEFSPLLDYSPFPVRRRIIFERKKLGRAISMLPEFLHLCRQLRREKYDLAIDFQGLLRSAICARISRAKLIVGIANPREKAAKLCYHRTVSITSRHAIDRHIELVNRLFGDDTPTPEIPVPATPAPLPTGLPTEKLIVLLPGARWSSKRFPAELFAVICEKLHRDFPLYNFVLSGAPDDAKLAQELVEQLPNGFPLINLIGKTTLPQLFALLAQSDAVLSNDSGPLHIAAFLRRPCFAFYGSTDPDRTGPWYPQAKVYRNRELDCLGCLHRECPDRSLRCHILPAMEIAADIAQVLPEN